MAAVWKPSWERAWKIVTDFDLKYSREVYYDPLHFLSLMADQALVNSLGPNPGIAKVMNVAYHVINSLLVLSLLLMTGAGTRASFIGALVFAAHPIQVGTVAWIAGKKEPSCHIILPSLNDSLPEVSCARFGEVSGIRSRSFYPGFAVQTFRGHSAGCVVLPRGFLQPGKGERPRCDLSAGSAGRLGSGVGIVCTFNREDIHFDTSALALSPFDRGRGGLVLSLEVFFAPLQLVPLYPRWDVVGHPGWFIVLLAAFVGLAGVLVYFRKRLDRWILWGAVFFLINLSLVSGLIPFGYMTYTFVADHFLYLPMVGLALIVARCIYIFSRSFGFDTLLGKIVIASLYAWIAVLGLVSVKQTLLWRDPYSVWEETLEINKTSFAAYNNYGVLCLDRGEYEKAIGMFKEAARLAPKLDKPYNNMGWAYTLMGDTDSAKQAYEKSLEIDPNGELPQRMIGRILDREGRFDDAIATFRKALAANPDSGAALQRPGTVAVPIGPRGRFNQGL